jgi:hypothetical protein
VTVEACIVALIFGTQSVLLELDEGFISTEEKENLEYRNQVKNLNDLVYVYKRLLQQQYNLNGYITITEEQGQWDLPNSFMPVVLNADDFVTLIQDENGNQGSDESRLVKHLYQINYNIWESIIRDAMVTGAVPITYDQMHRFLAPVISDHNNNLLMHFSYKKQEALEHIIALPGFQEYYKYEHKMFPIYFNFFGESHITIALQARDTASFY